MKVLFTFITLCVFLNGNAQTINPFGGFSFSSGAMRAGKEQFSPGLRVRAGGKINLKERWALLISFDYGAFNSSLEKTSVSSVGGRIELMKEADSISRLKPMFGIARDLYFQNSKSREVDGLTLEPSKSNWYQNSFFVGTRYWMRSNQSFHAQLDLYMANPMLGDYGSMALGAQMGYSYFFISKKRKEFTTMVKRLRFFTDLSAGSQQLTLRGEKLNLGIQYKWKTGVLLKLASRTAISADGGIVVSRENAYFDSYISWYFSLGPHFRFPLKNEKAIALACKWNVGKYLVSQYYENSFHPIPAKPFGYGFNSEMAFEFSRKLSAVASCNLLRFYTNRINIGYNDVSGSMIVPSLGVRFYLN